MWFTFRMRRLRLLMLAAAAGCGGDKAPQAGPTESTRLAPVVTVEPGPADSQHVPPPVVDALAAYAQTRIGVVRDVHIADGAKISEAQSGIGACRNGGSPSCLREFSE